MSFIVEISIVHVYVTTYKSFLININAYVKHNNSHLEAGNKNIIY